MAQKNFFSYVFGGAWRLWDFFCRLVINAVITLLVVVLLLAVFGSRHISVPSSSALVLDMQGDLVEQFSGDPQQRAFSRLLGSKQEPQVRLRDVVDAVEHAKDDDRIKALVLETDGMQNAGLVPLQDVAHAIRDFRKSGKPVFALGDSYTQEQYYLASTAGTVFIHPQGQVFLHGFGIYEPYFKEALDKLGVEVNIFRVGKYKSAVEPFMLTGMSPEARENYNSLLNQLWADYTHDVISARKLPANALDSYIKDMDTNLAAVGGDGARMALKEKLVDKIATEDQMAAAVQKVVGEYRHTFRQVGYQDYVTATNLESGSSVGDGDKVGVIVAEGDIKNGDQPPGVIGGDSTAELIRNARYDDAVKAVVLRVDSPGGSSFASDIILREIELTKEAGKPVVVSMGNLAASGGYWISMAGDEIYASPATITGSIGIFGMLPTFQKSLAKIGIATDGVGTSPISDALDITRSMSPQVKEALQLFINHGYEEFIGKVAKNRHMKVQDVDAIAQGRVWSGEDGKRIGIVDKFGDLQDAVAEAAKLAELGKRYKVQYIEKPLSFYDRMLIGLASDSGDDDSRLAKISQDAFSPWYQRLLKTADLLKVFDDPRGAYAYCFCNIH